MGWGRATETQEERASLSETKAGQCLEIPRMAGWTDTQDLILQCPGGLVQLIRTERNFEGLLLLKAKRYETTIKYIVKESKERAFVSTLGGLFF